MSQNLNGIVSEAAALAVSAQEPLEVPEGVNGLPFAVVPQGYQLVTPPGWEPLKPHRVKQVFKTHDVGSFVGYLKAYGDSDVTMIYASVSDVGANVLAVLDAHGSEGPDWQSHRVMLTPKATTEWLRWTGVNGKQFTQVEFAQFVENNALDVVQPSGADLLTICNEFEVEGAVQYQRIQRLSSGAVKFAYTDEKTAKAGGVEVPEVFKLRVRIFEGTQPVEVAARFRYRLKQAGELVLWFELVNPHIAVRQQIQGLVDQIMAATVGEVLIGEITN